MPRRPALRVFVSHTSEFAEHPAVGSYVRAVEKAVLAHGWTVTDMAYFAARDQRPAELCREKVREADVYLGLIGLRYGSPVRDRPEVSHTELEFTEAGQSGLPRLMFLLDERRETRLPPAALSDDRYGDRQRAFRTRIRAAGLTTASFSTPDDLEILVARALVDAERRAQPVLEMVPALTHPAVARPEPRDALLAALDAGSTVTGLVGSGGFGKTTLAAEAARHPRVCEMFPGGRLWVTLGQDAVGPALTNRINDLSERLTGRRPTLIDPEQAGFFLGGVLPAGSLLVIDDVWTADQLRPLLAGGSGCARLVTTRRAEVLPWSAAVVPVAAMHPGEAQELLTGGIAGADVAAVQELARATRGWPFLLQVAAGTTRTLIEDGATIDTALDSVRAELDAAGSDPLRAAIDSALHPADPAADRFAELAVFGEDTAIPMTTLIRYWDHRAGLPAHEAERLCGRLAALGLLTVVDGAGIQLHDVVRDHVRERAGARLPAMHAALVDAHRSDAWWNTPADEPYLADHLITHLRAAGLPEADTLVTDLRWVVHRLETRGPVAVEADLAADGRPIAAQLATAIRQNAHQLHPITPPHSRAAVLLYLLSAYPALRPLIEAYGPPRSPHLEPVAGPYPSRPHPALRRSWPIRSEFRHRWVVVGPDGTWLATASDYSGELEVWNVDGSRRARSLVPSGSWIGALAVASDGVWTVTESSADRGCELSRRSPDLEELFTARFDRRIAQLHPAAGDSFVAVAGERLVHRPAGGRAVVSAWLGPSPTVAVAPDGSWLAGGSDDVVVRIWSPDGELLGALTGHTAAVRGLAVAPDGSWLASTAEDGTTRLWRPDAATPFRILPVGGADVSIAPDGSWLAVRVTNQIELWEVDTGRRRSVLPVPGVTDMAPGPDGSWLATVAHGRVVQIWDCAPVELLPEHDPDLRAPLPAGLGPRGVHSQRLVEDDPNELTPEDGPAVLGALYDPTRRHHAVATAAGAVRVGSSGWICALRLGEPPDQLYWTSDGELAIGRHGATRLFRVRY